MTKAKRGEPNYRRRYFLYGALAVMGVLLISMAVLAIIINHYVSLDAEYKRALYEVPPVVPTELLLTAQYLIEYPEPTVSYLDIETNQLASRQTEICVLFKTGPNLAEGVKIPDLVPIFEINGKPYGSYNPIGWNVKHCIQVMLEKGYHLIWLRTVVSTDQWGILVE